MDLGELPQSTSLTAPSAEGASARYTLLRSHIVQIVRFYGYLQGIILPSPLPQKRVARHSRDGCSSPIRFTTNSPLNPNLTYKMIFEINIYITY